MEPTKILSDEHRVIELMLRCLDRIALEAKRNGKLDKDSAEKGVDFIRNFADKCHHGKEEDQLFTVLNEKGLPADSGPVGVMLGEHELGRSYVTGMADNIDKASDGDKDSLVNFVTNARNYIDLLQAHIQKEDTVLFPMASRLLNEQEKQAVIEQFNHVEENHMGTGTHEKYLKTAEELADKYQVKFDKSILKPCGCGH